MTVIIGYKKQEAGTNFFLFSRSRYMIGKFMTIYLQRPIKILEFITSKKI